jgi:hypothetical protein
VGFLNDPAAATEAADSRSARQITPDRAICTPRRPLCGTHRHRPSCGREEVLGMENARRYPSRVEETDGIVYKTRLDFLEPGPLADIVEEMVGHSLVRHSPAPWQPHCFAVTVHGPTEVGEPDEAHAYAALWVPASRQAEAEERLIAHGFAVDDKK